MFGVIERCMAFEWRKDVLNHYYNNATNYYGH